MRLWHEKLLPYLSKQWLMGQHRECCALRGKGWGRNHSTVNYVFDYSYACLWEYHRKVIALLEKMCVQIDQNWKDLKYRGKKIGRQISITTLRHNITKYKEHDSDYFKECLENLLLKLCKGKQVFRENGWEDLIKSAEYGRFKNK